MTDLPTPADIHARTWDPYGDGSLLVRVVHNTADSWQDWYTIEAWIPTKPVKGQPTTWHWTMIKLGRSHRELPGDIMPK